MDTPETLDDAWSQAWSQLRRAVKDRKHPWRTPSVATVSPDGRPRSRIVVLRGAVAGPPELAFHTDLRSDKLDDLRAHPWVAWTFWNPKQRVQLRAVGRAIVQHDDDEAEAAWERTGLLGRRTYVCEPGPGTPLDRPGSGLPEHVRDGRVSEGDVAHGRDVFARIACRIVELERLDLALEGHLRARWHIDDEGRIDGGWLVP